MGGVRDTALTRAGRPRAGGRRRRAVHGARPAHNNPVDAAAAPSSCAAASSCGCGSSSSRARRRTRAPCGAASSTTSRARARRSRGGCARRSAVDRGALAPCVRAVGDEARGGLPRGATAWFLTTFCAGGQGVEERTGKDPIWDAVASFNMYDSMAMLATVPALRGRYLDARRSSCAASSTSSSARPSSVARDRGRRAARLWSAATRGHPVQPRDHDARAHAHRGALGQRDRRGSASSARAHRDRRRAVPRHRARARPERHGRHAAAPRAAAGPSCSRCSGRGAPHARGPRPRARERLDRRERARARGALRPRRRRASCSSSAAGHAARRSCARTPNSSARTRRVVLLGGAAEPGRRAAAARRVHPARPRRRTSRSTPTRPFRLLRTQRLSVPLVVSASWRCRARSTTIAASGADGVHLAQTLKRYLPTLAARVPRAPERPAARGCDRSGSSTFCGQPDAPSASTRASPPSTTAWSGARRLRCTARSCSSRRSRARRSRPSS